MNADKSKLVLWSPHVDNQFVVVSSSLRLFECTGTASTSTSASAMATAVSNAASNEANGTSASMPPPSSLQPPHTSSFSLHPPPRNYSLLDTITFPQQQIKAAAWCTDRQDTHLLGTGSITGSLTLVKFLDDVKIVKEFLPRYARMCHCVAWNPVFTQQVAVGLDRVRNGCGTLIWDTNQRGSVLPGATSSAVGVIGGGAGAAAGTAYEGASSSSAGFASSSSFVTPSAALAAASAAGASPSSSSSSAYAAYSMSVGGVSTAHAASGASPAAAAAAAAASASSSGSRHTFSISATRATESVTEPLALVSNSEATLSMSWLPNDPHSLAVGTGFKWLRIYDVRSHRIHNARYRPLSVVAHSKSVYGCKFDPFCPSRLATYSEDGIVKVWDLRALRGPVLSLLSNGGRVPPPASSPTAASASAAAAALKCKQVIEMEWCTSTPGLMCTISKDDDFLRMWDLSGSLPETIDAVDHAVHLSDTSAPESAPCRTRYASSTLSSLSWHPTIKQRLLTVTLNGTVEDVYVHDTVPVDWSPFNHLTFAIDDRMYCTGAPPVSAVGRGGGNSRGPSSRPSPSSSPLLQPSDAESIAAGLVSASPGALHDAVCASDIATQMQRRADADYGLDTHLNQRLCGELHEPHLFQLWTWVNHCQSVSESSLATPSSPSASAGANSGPSSSASASSDRSLIDRFAGISSLFAAALARTCARTSTSPAPEPTLVAAHAASGSAATDVEGVPASSDSTTTTATATTTATPTQGVLGSTPVDTQDGSSLSSVRVWTSAERSLALRNCGWFDTFGSAAAAATASAWSSVEAVNLENALRTLEDQGNFERAAFLALLHLDLPRALQALTRGAHVRSTSAARGDGGSPSAAAALVTGPDLGLVAIALSGYSSAAAQASASSASASASASLWSQTFSTALRSMNMDAHVKAIFSFLSSCHGHVDHDANGSAAASSSSPRASHPYHHLLHSCSLGLRDLVAFACRFLDDHQLLEFLARCTERAVQQGDLAGLLLTGLGSSGVELLQSYLDRTSDIQTTAALAAYAHAIASASAPDTDPDPRLQQWIQVYRDVLNQLRYWTVRAKFDVARALLLSSLQQQREQQHQHAYGLLAKGGARLGGMQRLTPSSTGVSATGPSPAGGNSSGANSNSSSGGSGGSGGGTGVSSLAPPQVSVRCTFCGQMLSLDGLAGNKASGAARTTTFRTRGRIGGNKFSESGRVRGCPNCRKSLPRCALCLVGLDAAVPQPTTGIAAHGKGGAGATSSSSSSSSSSLTPLVPDLDDPSSAEDKRFESSSMNVFGSWFTWCQQCRHGGHAQHILEWFATHEECPVTDCHCRCRARDRVERWPEWR